MFGFWLFFFLKIQRHLCVSTVCTYTFFKVSWRISSMCKIDMLLLFLFFFFMKFEFRFLQKNCYKILSINGNCFLCAFGYLVIIQWKYWWVSGYLEYMHWKTHIFLHMKNKKFSLVNARKGKVNQYDKNRIWYFATAFAALGEAF